MIIMSKESKHELVESYLENVYCFAKHPTTIMTFAAMGTGLNWYNFTTGLYERIPECFVYAAIAYALTSLTSPYFGWILSHSKSIYDRYKQFRKK